MALIFQTIFKIRNLCGNIYFNEVKSLTLLLRWCQCLDLNTCVLICMYCIVFYPPPHPMNKHEHKALILLVDILSIDSNGNILQSLVQLIFISLASSGDKKYLICLSSLMSIWLYRVHEMTILHERPHRAYIILAFKRKKWV